MKFSSLAETPDFVVVSLVLPNVKEIRVEIDYAKEEVKVRAWSLQSGALDSLKPSDRAVLARLAAAARWGRASRAEEALASTLNFLDSYPAGEVVDLSTAGRKKLLHAKKFASLCGKTGSPVVGTYTVGAQVFTETAARALLLGAERMSGALRRGVQRFSWGFDTTLYPGVLQP